MQPCSIGQHCKKYAGQCFVPICGSQMGKPLFNYSLTSKASWAIHFPIFFVRRGLVRHFSNGDKMQWLNLSARGISKVHASGVYDIAAYQHTNLPQVSVKIESINILNWNSSCHMISIWLWASWVLVNLCYLWTFQLAEVPGCNSKAKVSLPWCLAIANHWSIQVYSLMWWSRIPSLLILESPKDSLQKYKKQVFFPK